VPVEDLGELFVDDFPLCFPIGGGSRLGSLDRIRDVLFLWCAFKPLPRLGLLGLLWLRL
jgi:hypothetical protein